MGENRATWFRNPLTSSAGLVVLVVAVTLGASAGLQFVQGAGAQVFSAAGASRRIVLPLVYLLAVVVILRTGLRNGRVPTGPFWLWFPLAGAVVSFAVNLGDFLADGLVTNLIQGFLLLGGFSLVGVAGAVSGAWPARMRRLLLVTLTLGALAAVLLPIPSLTLNPYAALVVPAVFAALLMALRGKEHRKWWLLAAAVIGGLGLRALHPGPGQPISIAVLGQIGIAAGVVLLCVAVRSVRIVVLTMGAFLIVLLALMPQVRGYLTGTYTGTDVTLAQRAYEARQVQHAVLETNTGLVIGRGPHATVDLTNSPDRATLLSSGRVLDRVDDVHLLTAYTLLKLGLFGLLWLAMLVVVAYRLLWRELLAPDMDVWRICMSIYVLCGLMVAFPAGTELFSNPLAPLLLGVLWADARGGTPTPRLRGAWQTRLVPVRAS